jgi:hypothetical protein
MVQSDAWAAGQILVGNWTAGFKEQAGQRRAQVVAIESAIDPQGLA